MNSRFCFQTPPTPQLPGKTYENDSIKRAKEAAKVENAPILNSFLGCCSLTIGIMTLTLILVIFDLTFAIKRAKYEKEYEIEFSGIEKHLKNIDVTIVTFSTMVNILMIVATLIFAVPEKYNSMLNGSRIWGGMQAIAAAWKLGDVVYSTLPKEGYAYVLSFPEFNRDEIIGQEALIIAWSLAITYIILSLIDMMLVYSHLVNLLNKQSEIIEENPYDRMERHIVPELNQANAETTSIANSFTTVDPLDSGYSERGVSQIQSIGDLKPMSVQTTPYPGTLPKNATLQTANGPRPAFQPPGMKPPRPRKPSLPILQARAEQMDKEISCDEHLVDPNNGTLPNRFSVEQFEIIEEIDEIYDVKNEVKLKRRNSFKVPVNLQHFQAPVGSSYNESSCSENKNQHFIPPSRPRSRQGSRQINANKLDYTETMSDISRPTKPTNHFQPEAKFADQAATLARSWIYSTEEDEVLPSIGPGPPASLLASSVDSMSRCESPAATIPVCRGVISIPTNENKYPNFGTMCNK